MCGIVGVISNNEITDFDWVKKGIKKLEHRGPDSFGLWQSEDRLCVFGHTRLSILDLSELGNQPMCREDLGIAITFNGEIYNYIQIREELLIKGYNFKSKSDTEVLLLAYHCWGSGFLSRINGMYSFAIYDFKNRKFFIARDRAGEKPLFYIWDKKNLYFASEIKALLDIPNIKKKVNRQALHYYLSIGYVPSPMCILEDFQKLPPANAIELDCSKNKFNIYRYWNLPSPSFNLDENQIEEQFEYLLSNAVKRQMVADVPVGVLLSGGVDSSLITAFASEVNSKINTFTVTLPGNSKFDESEHARLIAKHFNTNHFEVSADEIITFDLFENVCTQFDEPIIDSSMIPTYMVSKLVSNTCKVALGGDGGDELFAGYQKYIDFIKFEQFSKYLPFKTRNLILSFINSALPVGFKGRNLMQYFGLNYDSSKLLLHNHFDSKSMSNLLINDYDFNFDLNDTNTFNIRQNLDLIGKVTEIDFLSYLPEDILTKVDRTSMLNSLEIRAPFLDMNLIEFAFSSVPTRLKINKLDKKILLKRICQKKLPKNFNLNRKQGFSIPLDKILISKDWISNVEGVLFDNHNTLFNKGFIRGLLNGQIKGRANSERLYGILCFEIWRNKYNISI